MYISEGEIVGYKWKLYYGSTLLIENDDIYDTEEEAREEAQSEIDHRIELWKLDDAWHEWDSEEDFDVVIDEVTDNEI